METLPMDIGALPRAQVVPHERRIGRTRQLVWRYSIRWGQLEIAHGCAPTWERAWCDLEPLAARYGLRLPRKASAD